MLKWLWGTSFVSLLLALASDQILKVLSNEATIINHNVRGGVFGAVTGIAMGVFGTPKARKSVSGWREKIFSPAKNK